MTRPSEALTPVAQAPNPALGVWAVATALSASGWFDDGASRTFRDVGRGALVTWGTDEVVRGDSLVRRLVGGVVVGVQLVTLFD